MTSAHVERGTSELPDRPWHLTVMAVLYGLTGAAWWVFLILRRAVGFDPAPLTEVPSLVMAVVGLLCLAIALGILRRLPFIPVLAGVLHLGPVLAVLWIGLVRDRGALSATPVPELIAKGLVHSALTAYWFSPLTRRWLSRRDRGVAGVEAITN